MHILTKIFVVLVSLLAVMLVPLVVVYASNEGSYREKYMAEQAVSSTKVAQLKAEQAGRAAFESRMLLEKQQLEQQIVSLQKERDTSIADIRKLQNDLSAAQNASAGVNAQLATLVQTNKTGTELTDSLVGELRQMREIALASERRAVELDEQLRSVETALEVADAARRALQEEIQRLTDEKQRALDDVSSYAAYYGPLPDKKTADTAAVAPDRNLTAVILDVERTPEATLAEINAGSRDGVREGWVMTIANGGTFIGRLRIIKVDVNRSTGVVELEDAAARGPVTAGQRAIARIGG